MGWGLILGEDPDSITYLRWVTGRPLDETPETGTTVGDGITDSSFGQAQASSEILVDDYFELIFLW